MLAKSEREEHGGKTHWTLRLGVPAGMLVESGRESRDLGMAAHHGKR